MPAGHSWQGAGVRSLVLSSASETGRLGEIAGKLCHAGTIFALSGEFGAGKTTFAQGVARGLGVRQTVSSPTFTMMNEYDSGRLPLIHMDLYRLADGNSGGFEMLGLELEEIMAGGSVLVVEWAELGKEVLPPGQTISINFTRQETGRKVFLTGSTDAAEQLVDALAQGFVGGDGGSKPVLE